MDRRTHDGNALSGGLFSMPPHLPEEEPDIRESGFYKKTFLFQETYMTLNRRAFIQSTAAAAAAATSTTLWAADTIKIGFVTPLTGPLALFGEADKWTVDQMKQAFKDGISVAGKKYSVEILIKDSQSTPNRAAEVASDLILKDKITLMVVSSTPETTNPVSDVCELNEMPCISSVCPWQP